ncbi:hypothetical protein [Streptomyces sp. NPDC054829]
MTADQTGGTVVTGRANRFVTTGCLTALIALITVLGVAVGWLWYRHWDDGKVNSDRRDEAYASIQQRVRAETDDTAHALGESRAADADTLTGVIRRHSQAPLITYDASRREFTATAEHFAQYDEKAILGGGPVRVTRCFVVTYAHGEGRAWTSRVLERDGAVCRPGAEIEGLARLTRNRIANLYPEDLTEAGVRKALDPTGDVRGVVRGADTVTVSVVLSTADGKTSQCYRFTRPLNGSPDSTTAVPASSC